MRTVLAALAAAATIAIVSVASVSDVSAQATCRQKCTDDEQACLKRTNNKGQCGSTAQACLAKCK
jgi:uncharacterized low-complexity protein